MNDGPVDDLILYMVLFVIVLLACALLLWGMSLASDAARKRWRARQVEPTPEERVRAAILQLESVGVDVAGLLGEWAPEDP
jgi:cytochrome c-type biogenesis protein CcmH/NrfG